MIRFSWEGKKYKVDDRAYHCETIVLPDGTAIRPHAWFESLPPRMDGAEEVPHLFKSLTPNEIANHLGNAIVAEDA